MNSHAATPPPGETLDDLLFQLGRLQRNLAHTSRHLENESSAEGLTADLTRALAMLVWDFECLWPAWLHQARRLGADSEVMDQLADQMAALKSLLAWAAPPSCQ
ncbi:MAG: hypothetical protein KQJ78_23315 [Deltaproteobacteria bacterium]|nr:hypothetical protein [Deltaproteobacteria bacterium]